MIVHTKHGSDQPLIQHSDLVVVFSPDNKISVSQFDDLIEAEFYKKRILWASAVDGTHTTPLSPIYATFQWFGLETLEDTLALINTLNHVDGDQNMERFRWAPIVHGSHLLRCLRSAQSPIEKSLIRALSHTVLWSDSNVACQHRIGKYRVDLALTHRSNPVKVVVEADGHDFHERTKEQAQHDKQRDRELQSMGWRVLRFTGSEIHRDAAGCAAQIADFFGRLYMELGAA